VIGRRPWSRRASVAYLAVVYAAAIGIAWFVAMAAIDIGDWQAVLIADVAATVFVFVMAAAASNTSVYDPYWSVAPLPIALWWAMHGAPSPPLEGVIQHSPDAIRFAAVAILLLLWGTRLTANFLRGWPGLGHEDWRYTEYRRFGAVRYWLISLGGLQMMPTLIVFAAMLPVLAVTRVPGNGFGMLDVMAIVVTSGFVLLEAVADEQKRRYRGDGFITTGVWAWCRHPNYLGEVGFWWGIFLFALAAGWGNWWTIAGPVAMTVLFVGISVPLMDRRMLRRPGYAEHISSVPALIPRPPR
jgi:steroid 5-alpha reductase family enzyme